MTASVRSSFVADTITPLRQRMIEDMNARKLCGDAEVGPMPEPEKILGRFEPS